MGLLEFYVIDQQVMHDCSERMCGFHNTGRYFSPGRGGACPSVVWRFTQTLLSLILICFRSLNQSGISL